MPRSSSNGNSVVDASIDWITFVTVTEFESNDLVKWIDKQAQLNTDLEDITEPWRGLGYIGFRKGPFKWGVRGRDEAIAIISGSIAPIGLLWSEIGIGHPTRVDLQVTVQLEKPNRNVARETYADQETQNLSGRKPRYIKLLASPSGETVYVGRRTSNVMLRLYDKSFDYGETKSGQIWRYEVEYKGRAAGKALTQVRRSNDVVQAVSGMVFAEYVKRGVRPRFRSDNQISAIEVSAEISTLQTKIRWLEKGVSPVVAQLCNAGYEMEVLTALKLKHILTNSGGS